MASFGFAVYKTLRVWHFIFVVRFLDTESIVLLLNQVGFLPTPLSQRWIVSIRGYKLMAES